MITQWAWAHLHHPLSWFSIACFTTDLRSAHNLTVSTRSIFILVARQLCDICVFLVMLSNLHMSSA